VEPICHNVGNTFHAKYYVNFYNLLFVLLIHVQLPVVYELI
jgi:hypothetical protein